MKWMGLEDYPYIIDGILCRDADSVLVLRGKLDGVKAVKVLDAGSTDAARMDSKHLTTQVVVRSILQKSPKQRSLYDRMAITLQAIIDRPDGVKGVDLMRATGQAGFSTFGRTINQLLRHIRKPQQKDYIRKSDTKPATYFPGPKAEELFAHIEKSSNGALSFGT
jgi:hypothetical protein